MYSCKTSYNVAYCRHTYYNKCDAINLDEWLALLKNLTKGMERFKKKRKVWPYMYTVSKLGHRCGCRCRCKAFRIHNDDYLVWYLFFKFLWLLAISYIFVAHRWRHYTPAQRSWKGGILDSPCPSVRPSVRPSVCRRHGLRSISQVCFGISISNFICMLMVAIGRGLLIFSVDTFKMAAWWPYWIFWFPDSNFNLALNINFKLQRHNTYVYG